MQALALKILQVDLAGGTEAEKIARLRALLGPEELAQLPGRWIASHGADLSWDDNLVEFAVKTLGLPSKPLAEDDPEMARYRREVKRVLVQEGAAGPS